MNKKYLKQLSLKYPTIKLARAEIINMSANLNLPKGTEHFISDIHGEYESFQHVLKNGSGSIAKKIDDEFGDELTDKEKRTLGTLIYYPEEKVELIEQSLASGFNSWCKKTLLQLIRVASRMSSKYTREKYKRAIKPEYEYIVEELLTEKKEVIAKELYYNEILDAIIETDSAKEYIIVFCRLIQHLAIDRLHVIGDIFDRGNDSMAVMERLCHYHSVDIEWGNHDIEWMGAANGSYACIASVIRIAVRYANVKTLETDYGISLMPLLSFAYRVYKDDPCEIFKTNFPIENDNYLYSKLHKAITIILFKLEGALSEAHPEFGMDNRRLLEHLDLDNGTITIDGAVYELKDKNFPTISKENPYKLSADEAYVMEQLKTSFLSSERLQRHVEFLYNRGGMYRVYNGNLLYHGCVPLNDDGSFKEVQIGHHIVKGKELFDKLEKYARYARYSKLENKREYGKDIMYFMWASPLSPMFGKEKMATFERYFLNDDSVKKEVKNSYYYYYDNEEIVKNIFNEFEIDYENGHIINGHIPVAQGESPIHCNGKVIIIDGGFSKAYQKVTGIAGYTLVSNSHGMKIVAHNPFVSTKDAIINETDIHSEIEFINASKSRLRVRDTDKGRDMSELISDLKDLIKAYKEGIIREHQL